MAAPSTEIGYKYLATQEATQIISKFRRHKCAP
jgi:hypothetical protein